MLNRVFIGGFKSIGYLLASALLALALLALALLAYLLLLLFLYTTLTLRNREAVAI